MEIGINVVDRAGAAKKVVSRLLFCAGFYENYGMSRGRQKEILALCYGYEVEQKSILSGVDKI